MTSEIIRLTHRLYRGLRRRWPLHHREDFCAIPSSLRSSLPIPAMTDVSHSSSVVSLWSSLRLLLILLRKHHLSHHCQHHHHYLRGSSRFIFIKKSVRRAPVDLFSPSTQKWLWLWRARGITSSPDEVAFSRYSFFPLLRKLSTGQLRVCTRARQGVSCHICGVMWWWRVMDLRVTAVLLFSPRWGLLVVATLRRRMTRATTDEGRDATAAQLRSAIDAENGTV